jgi:serine/threonine protein kinase
MCASSGLSMDDLKKVQVTDTSNTESTPVNTETASADAKAAPVHTEAAPVHSETSRAKAETAPANQLGPAHLVGVATEFAQGQIVAERYKVESILGRGGMGVVYKVEQIFIRKEYAMKTLEVQGVKDIAWRRFQKEAQVIGRLDHPNAIRIHDSGLIDGKQPFYVMDLVHGESLEARIKRAGPLPVEEALKIFTQISFALSHAHEKGVIHRDIKPSNIMLDTSQSSDTDKCTAKLVDFGISKLVQEGSDAQNLTRTGEIFGSPLYMSPEQCLGASVDYRTDIYSVGCALFDALTGTPPHIGDSSLSTMMKHKEEKPPSLREASLGKEFPQGLEQLVARLLEKDPQLRYQTFDDVARDLISLQSGLPLTPPMQVQQSPLKGPKLESLVIKGLAFGAVLAIAIFVFLQLSQTPSLRAQKDAFRAEQTEFASTIPAKPAAKTVPEDPEIKWLYENQQIVERTENQRLVDDVDFKTPFSTICTDQSGRKVRVFQFPYEFSVGNIITDKNKRMAAQGDVLIPSLAPITLQVSYECCERPQLIGRFRKDEVAALILDYTQSAGDDDLAYVNNWTQLQKLSAQSVPRVSDKGLSALTNLPKLKQLILKDTKTSGVGIGGLKCLKQLNLLYAGFTSQPKKILDALKGSTEIRVLRLWATGMTDSDLKDIGSLKSLVELDISDNKRVTDLGMSYISSLPNLQVLHIQWCSLTPNCIHSLRRMPQLTSLKFSTEGWSPESKKALCEALTPRVTVEFKTERDRHFLH